mmetsp:Transcript_3148/g.6177  ORF Transcript_3148/g.6177 Transcript_3148/m.6177 type:complete len:231 (+) Transcript_3148:1308-2000(+)
MNGLRYACNNSFSRITLSTWLSRSSLVFFIIFITTRRLFCEGIIARYTTADMPTPSSLRNLKSLRVSPLPSMSGSSRGLPGPYIVLSLSAPMPSGLKSARRPLEEWLMAPDTTAVDTRDMRPRLPLSLFASNTYLFMVVEKVDLSASVPSKRRNAARSRVTVSVTTMERTVAVGGCSSPSNVTSPKKSPSPSLLTSRVPFSISTDTSPFSMMWKHAVSTSPCTMMSWLGA